MKTGPHGFSSFEIGDKVEHKDLESNWSLFNGKVIGIHGGIGGDVITVMWRECGHSRPIKHLADELRLRKND